ncbi:MAG: hypothetical protein QM570_10935 [Planctomycetota bacterium]|nr:hypothetical protein [Planctomycetota bacterium]
MTTEIAIMNKSAVALAADSAVTIVVTGSQGNTHKVLNSANKLFSLSKCAPVGLMIYGNASMLGVPWETIVKMYRERLGDHEYPTLAGYCEDFFAFLDGFDIPDDLQRRYVADGAMALFREIKGKLDEWVAGQLAAKRPVEPQQVEMQLREFIKSKYNEFLNFGRQSVLSETKRSNLRQKYRKHVQDIAKRVFGQLPLARQMHSQLLTITVNAASIGPMNQSGVVIAGFGADDLYPSCQNFDVAAVFAGRTIKRDGKAQTISHNMGAAIIPFAQSDDVMTFMEGIGPVLSTFLRKAFYDMMMSGLPDRLRDELALKLGLSDPQKCDVRKIAGEMCKGACDYVFAELQKHQRSYYIDPVVKATGHLDKSELAAMAETLVNLVSFRKQVSMEAETVGGPIDVAVITKGDGLVWIKRKHYFPAELNHHFFSNYYRKVNCHGCQEPE